MSPEYILKQLIEHGEKMRLAQECYFKEKDWPTKRIYLTAAKQAEAKFDQLIREAKQLIKCS